MVLELRPELSNLPIHLAQPHSKLTGSSELLHLLLVYPLSVVQVAEYVD